MLAMLDKQRTVELAREAGVPTPRTAQPAGDAELRAVADEFAYPCALKPVSSYLFAARFGVLKKVVMVHDREELIREYSALFELGVPMQVTEVIPGPDTAYSSLYSYLDERGEPLFAITKSKLRGWPIHFGLTTYHQTSDVPEVVEVGLRFFRHIGLRGVGNVEFKRDERDGEWRIIECNHRFTAANDLMPGLCAALVQIKRDESRHIAYGVYLLSRLVAAHPDVWDVVQARMEELLPVALAFVEESFGPYPDQETPFGITTERALSYPFAI